MTSEAMTSKAMSSEAMTSKAMSSEAMTSEAMTSKAMTSEAMTSEAMTSKAMTSKGMTSTGMTSAAMTDHPMSSAMTGHPKPAPAGVVITGADSPLGMVLFDGTGQAIYLFDKERTAVPDCYGDCAAAWPPVLTKGEPRGESGVSGSKLGTSKRSDGSTQVTYAGHPLYYFAHEGKNVVTCHNVSEFGGLWLAVTPAGKPA